MTNASQEGDVSFTLPSRSIEAKIWMKGKEFSHKLTLDTVVIEPNDKKTILVWRATVPCFNQFLYIQKVKIKEELL